MSLHPLASDAIRMEGELAACQDQVVQLQLRLHGTQLALAASQAAEARARQLAGRDPLTGLPNRLGFSETTARTLAEHIEGGISFCLLFIDLDDFKSVNDQHGHAAGDALLQVVGARLLHAVRAQDCVSRHGGDEFLCLLPQIECEDHAVAVARKLIDTVSAPCRLGDVSVQVHASVGIALYPEDGTTLPALMHRADRAMYWAKARRAGLVLARSVPPLFRPAAGASAASSC